MAYLQIVLGVGILLLCGDLLVRGAVALAVRLGIPTMVIGLTIVAFGTSAPELVVSLRAAVQGLPGIAIGNVVGSNIVNVLLVLGVPALICATNCDLPLARRNLIYVIGASVLFIVLCLSGTLRFWHGAILFAAMIAYLIETGRRSATSSEEAEAISDEAVEFVDGVAGLPGRPALMWSLIAIGLIGLPFGGMLTVNGAAGIARSFGVSETVIGLTLVAVGTSLPEFATNLMSALRAQSALALGNVLGSNLFNILAIMGLSAMLAPMPVPEAIIRVDVWVMLVAALALVPFIFFGGKSITWRWGLVFTAGYVLYVSMLFMQKTGWGPSLAVF